MWSVWPPHCTVLYCAQCEMALIRLIQTSPRRPLGLHWQKWGKFEILKRINWLTVSSAARHHQLKGRLTKNLKMRFGISSFKTKPISHTFLICWKGLLNESWSVRKFVCGCMLIGRILSSTVVWEYKSKRQKVVNFEQLFSSSFLKLKNSASKLRPNFSRQNKTIS